MEWYVCRYVDIQWPTAVMLILMDRQQVKSAGRLWQHRHSLHLNGVHFQSPVKLLSQPVMEYYWCTTHPIPFSWPFSSKLGLAGCSLSFLLHLVTERASHVHPLGTGPKWPEWNLEKSTKVFIETQTERKKNLEKSISFYVETCGIWLDMA